MLALIVLLSSVVVIVFACFLAWVILSRLQEILRENGSALQVTAMVVSLVLSTGMNALGVTCFWLSFKDVF